jgi:outer membrane biogenesis lipoprotein LolB
MNLTSPVRAAVLALAAAVITACAEPAPKPAAPVVTGPPKTGVVAVIQEKKESSITRDNWQDSVRYLFSNERDKTVVSVQYEVTVLYDDGTNGVVTVDQKPAYQPGQRVRVTGKQIEALRR